MLVNHMQTLYNFQYLLLMKFTHIKFPPAFLFLQPLLSAAFFFFLEYPADIEITYYEDYNLEERRPDAIYIHNPYDRCNALLP